MSVRANLRWVEWLVSLQHLFEKTAWQLSQYGSGKAAGYLRQWLLSIVIFAEYALERFEVPWISNTVERLMGEVSKRFKNQWMRWTADGLETLLQLRLSN